MKTRVTFRIPSELAETLRRLPNQTNFVERALRDALVKNCPMCAGTGRISAEPVHVTSVRHTGAFPLSRDTALQLKKVVAIARQLAATDVDLERASNAQSMFFNVRRGQDILLQGTLAAASIELHPR
jgi:hypothetical protein